MDNSKEKFRKVLKSKVVLLLLSGNTFGKDLLNVVKKIDNRKICYVSMNKGADALQDVFKKKKIKLKNILFLDCVSKTILTPKSQPNCVFISSPNALTELSLAITKCVKAGFPVILIDSLSTFMIYHPPDVINHFLHTLANQIRSESGETLLLTLSSKEKNSEVYKKLETIVDKVVNLEK